MRPCFAVAIPVALLSTACGRADGPTAPDPASLGLSARTSAFPHLDGHFGPIVLASCDGGFDLIYEQTGTVTIIETTDKTGLLTRLQFVWNLTASYTNSVTGYTISGPSYGPDVTTFNDDGTSRFVQYGLIVHLRTPDGIQVVDAGYIEFLIDESGNFSVVTTHGPKPVHDGFPERPVLCALVNR